MTVTPHEFTPDDDGLIEAMAERRRAAEESFNRNLAATRAAAYEHQTAEIEQYAHAFRHFANSIATSAPMAVDAITPTLTGAVTIYALVLTDKSNGTCMGLITSTTPYGRIDSYLKNLRASNDEARRTNGTGLSDEVLDAIEESLNGCRDKVDEFQLDNGLMYLTFYTRNIAL